MLYPLLLSASLASAAPARRPQVPAADAALKMRVEMERIEPQVKDLALACENLLSLVPGYAASADPGSGPARSQARRAVETARDRLEDSVSDFWHEAEETRAMNALTFFTGAVSGGRPDATATAASILQPPAFPKTAMHMHHLSQIVLIYEENAYRAAMERRLREQWLWVTVGLGGLLLGAVLSFVVTELLWFIRRPPPPGAVAPRP